MSGSFYALDTKYNSLLALVENLREDIVSISQGLANVLAVSNDGGAQDMVNLNNVTVSNLNYTTLTPAIPAIIGDIEQVLTTGNDAGTNELINLDALEITLGGTGITFPDGVTQTVAYTGAAITDTLGDVMSNGNIASTTLEMNTQSINGIIAMNGEPANNMNINSSGNLSHLSATTNIISTNVGAGTETWTFETNGDLTFPDTTVQSTAFTGVAATPDLGAVMTVGNTASTTLDMDANIITNCNDLNNNLLASDLDITSNQDLKLTALTDVDIQSGASIWSYSAGTGITFPDASVQTTAFTGTAATPTLGAVMTAGNVATADLDLATFGIQNGLAAADINVSSNQGINLVAVNDVVVSSGVSDWNFANGIGITFPDSSIQTTAYTGASPAAETLGDVMTNGNIASTDLDLDNNNILNLNNISGGVSSDIVCTSAAFNTYFNAGIGVGINTDIIGTGNTWLFNNTGEIEFPDGTLQSTAYQGSITGETLASVLTNGNDATQQDMLNLGTIKGQNIGFTGGWSIGDNNPIGSSDVAIEGTVPNSTMFFKCADGGGSPITQLSLNTVGAGNAFGGRLSMTDNFIEQVSNIVCGSSGNVVYTDDTEVRTGTALTLVGTALGGATGNYVVAIGAGTGGSGDFATQSVSLGSSVLKGIGAGGVAIGQNAGSNSTALAGAGVNSVAIGVDAAAGGSAAGSIAIGNVAGGATDAQGTNAVAIGVNAGGYGQNGSAIAIGTNAGRSTTTTAHQGTNSICIGNNAGVGWGAGGVPSNSLTISSIQTDATANPTLHYNTTTQEITYSTASSGSSITTKYDYTGASGSFINIPVPTGAIKMDATTYAVGGRAGVAYVGGSYYVMGGSGGGGGTTMSYGVPIENTTLDFYWTDGNGGTAFLKLTENGTAAPPPSVITFNLGTATNGDVGGAGQSAGTGAAGAGGVFTTNTAFPSGGVNGYAGQQGTSNAIPFGAPPPNTAAPTDVGRCNKQFSYCQEGTTGVGQKWLTNGSLGTTDTAYNTKAATVITWYF